MTQLAFQVKPARSKHIKDSKDRLFRLLLLLPIISRWQCLIITDIYDVREKDCVQQAGNTIPNPNTIYDVDTQSANQFRG